jgi:hypothetical protein
MADKVDPQVIDSVTIDNAKNIAGASSVAMATLYQVAASASGLAIQNAVSAQQNAIAISQAATTCAINILLHVDPKEAAALSTLKNADMPSEMLSILAALSANQQGAKVGQSTPPETATP